MTTDILLEKHASWTMRDFVHALTSRMPQEALSDALAKTNAELSFDQAIILAEFVDKWNLIAQSPVFWDRPYAVISGSLREDAREFVEEQGLPIEFANKFVTVVLNGYAYNVHTNKHISRALGITVRRRPTWSYVGIALIILGAVLYYTRVQAFDKGFVVEVLSQSGYVLMFSGLFAGHFRALGIHSRGFVWIVGIVLFLLSVLILNLDIAVTGL